MNLGVRGRQDQFWLFGSPVVKKARPLMDAPDARVSRSFPGLAVPLAEADWINWRA